MNHEKMYLISEDTYINHINEKVRLYALVTQLSRAVNKLPANRGSKELSEKAELYAKRSDEMFKSWKIPGSYLLFGDEEDLHDLMDSELFDLEDSGYVLCDSECEKCCPCKEDECCCDYEESNDDSHSNMTNNEDFNLNSFSAETYLAVSLYAFGKYLVSLYEKKESDLVVSD